MDKIKWETVTYTIAELIPGGGVVTQRDVLEKYKDGNPNQEIKAHTGFKCDHQCKTVSMRIGITDLIITTDSGIVAKIESGEVGENPVGISLVTVANIEPYGQKLQYPGYDGLVKKYNELENQLKCSNDVFLGSEKNYLELKEKYDALYIVYEELKVELKQMRVALFADEDSANLAEAEKAIAEDDSISLDEVEDAVENKEPVTDTEDGGDE